MVMDKTMNKCVNCGYLHGCHSKNCKRNAKVLIAAPVAGQKQYSLGNWLEWIVNQEHNNYDVAVCTNGKGYKELAEMFRQIDLTHKDGTKKKIITLELEESEELSVIQKITYAREKLRRYAVKHGYDYLFFLDTDTIPLFSDSIPLMIKKNVDVLSGLYYYKNSRVPVVIDQQTKTNVSDEKIKEYFLNDWIGEVWGFGFGCLLLTKEIFSQYAFDYDLMKETFSDDFGYCQLLENHDVQRFFYPKIMCRHLVDENQDSDRKVDIPIKIALPKNIKEENTTNNDGEKEDSHKGGITKKS